MGNNIPMIATGEPTGELVKATTEAGAKAISYTPPSFAEVFAELTKKYRKEDESPCQNGLS